MTDVVRVRKIYKLNSSGGGGGKKKGPVNGGGGEGLNGNGVGSEVDERKDLEISVLGCMALRVVTN
jgi:EKC/KEOPS complex subunit CGI121/TPRKB